MEAETVVTGKDLDAGHEPGLHELWAQSWYFDFAARDGTVGGFLRIDDRPSLGVTSWWVYVVSAGPGAGHDARATTAGVLTEEPIAAGEAAAGLPRRICGENLTGAVTNLGDGWRLTASAPGLGLDVVWRPTARPHRYARGRRFEQPGWARGTVTIGGVPRPLDGPGQRDHSWGVRDWWRLGWTWCAGWLSDAGRFQATLLDARGRIAPDGYRCAPGAPPTPIRAVGDEPDGVVLDGARLTFEDLATVTLELFAPDGTRTRLVRSMTAVRDEAGHCGIGWRERSIPDPR